MIKLSGMIFPIEAMPEYIRPIAYVLPLTYFNEIVRGLLIKETMLVDLSLDYLALVGFTLFFSLASIFKFKKYVA